MWSLQLRSFKDHFLVPLLHTLDTIASFKKQKIVPHHVLFCYMCANMPISNFIEEVAFGWKSFRLTWCKAKRLHSHPNRVLSNVTRIVLMFSSCDVMVSTQKRKIQFYLANCFNGRRNNSGKLEMNDFDFRQLIYFDFPLLSFVLKRNRTIGTMECPNDDRMRSTGKPTAFNFQVFRSLNRLLTGKAPD